MVKFLKNSQKEIRKRILQISHKYQLSHLGSCLSVVDLIVAIYEVKKPDEKFILSAGHGAVALYTVLERYNSVDAEELFIKHGVHPSRDDMLGIHCSSGSLGHGLPIAVGMALANRAKNVYCIITDGECAEGSVWEAFRIASENKLNNLKLLVNSNGYGAYSEISIYNLKNGMRAFGWNVIKTDGHNIKKLKNLLKNSRKRKPTVILAATKVNQLPFLKGLDAHYKMMSEGDFASAMDLLKK